MHRLFSLCGPAFVVATLAAIIGLDSGSPGSITSAAEVVSYYDHGIVRHILTAVVLTVSIPLLLVFAVQVAETDDAVRRSPWAHVLIGGSVLVGAALGIVALVDLALADAGDQNLPATVLQTLNVVNVDNWIVFNPAFGVMMLGAAGCLWPRVGAERWLARIALVLGILLFIPFANFVALLGTLVWIAVVGVLRAREHGKAPVASPVAVG